MIQIICGDAREKLRDLPDGSVHMVVTSPPYFGLRQYLPDGHTDFAKQIGLEASPVSYVSEMVSVFREVKRVLRSDGVVFLNLGDSYCSETESVRYVLREDCTIDELEDVALAVFGVRLGKDKAQGKGALCEVLPSGLSGETHSGGSQVPSGRVEEELREEPLRSDNPSDRAKSKAQIRRDSSPGRQMRVLQRDDAAILDAGSRSERRCGAPEEVEQVNDPDLSRCPATGVPQGSLSDTLLQLQLRDRYFRILSAREFEAAEIPTSVRACFKARHGIKPKDLIGIPWLVAFALRADGWWLRSDIIWAKRNCMPESVSDRPSQAHEHVFLLTKSARYFYDAEAIREEGVIPAGTRAAKGSNVRSEIKDVNGRPPEYWDYTGTRNARNVWSIATKPFADAHFATFPPELAERCISAGTSEKGCCAACGAPWLRTVNTPKPPPVVYTKRNAPTDELTYSGSRVGGVMMGHGQKLQEWRDAHPAKTADWRPSCQCNAAAVPCTVLDPFAGAFTALLVADRLQRSGIGIELNPEYCEMARRRLMKDAPLLTEISSPPPARTRPRLFS